MFVIFRLFLTVWKLNHHDIKFILIGVGVLGTGGGGTSHYNEIRAQIELLQNKEIKIYQKIIGSLVCPKRLGLMNEFLNHRL